MEDRKRGARVMKLRVVCKSVGILMYAKNMLKSVKENLVVYGVESCGKIQQRGKMVGGGDWSFLAVNLPVMLKSCFEDLLSVILELKKAVLAA
nr:hypothetical protein BaRGS_003111 [Batillaria attramentaria]